MVNHLPPTIWQIEKMYIPEQSTEAAVLEGGQRPKVRRKDKTQTKTLWLSGLLGEHVCQRVGRSAPTSDVTW